MRNSFNFIRDFLYLITEVEQQLQRKDLTDLDRERLEQKLKALKQVEVLIRQNL
jgi:hypothetical protein